MSSLAGFASTLLGVALFALIGIGIRLLVMLTIQQRRKRQNRQKNERLRVLIAAYKIRGGSITGQLSVDPRHLRDQRRDDDTTGSGEAGFDRARRIRDAVKAALSDIILLGTEDKVRLAGRAATDFATGHAVHIHEPAVSLRAFIRDALGPDAVAADLAVSNRALPGRGATAYATGAVATIRPLQGAAAAVVAGMVWAHRGFSGAQA